MKPGTTSPIDVFKAASESAVFYQLPHAGCLRISGDDRSAFLQRQSSNDLNLLSPAHFVQTVLTSPSARILDMLQVLADGETLLAITLPGRSTDTSRYLKSRIFFMDKVDVDDVSSMYAQLHLSGPLSSSVLQKVGLNAPEDENAFLKTAYRDVQLWLLKQAGELGEDYIILTPIGVADSLISDLERLGAIELDAETSDILRVESGTPGAAAELVSDYTPLEAGLQSAVSSSKGCFTGQEVLARQVTYDKITQKLVGVRLAEHIQAGVRAWHEAKAVGTLTSSVSSPRFGTIGLAIIKRPHFEPGTTLQFGESQDSTVQGTICELPFA